jgi:hypothetical protein
MCLQVISVRDRNQTPVNQSVASHVTEVSQLQRQILSGNEIVTTRIAQFYRELTEMLAQE